MSLLLELPHTGEGGSYNVKGKQLVSEIYLSHHAKLFCLLDEGLLEVWARWDGEGHVHE
jgi:hypothetical protein